MAISLKIDAVDSSNQSNLIIYGTLVFSGSYVSGGDTLNFLTAGTTQGGMGADAIKSLSLPQFSQIVEAPVVGTAASGYTYLFAPGTTQANGAVQLFLGGTQLSAGAYPAGVTGAVVRGRFEFPAFV
jgi:hypothetical protein